MEITEVFYPTHRSEWRAWLEANHQLKTEIWQNDPSRKDLWDGARGGVKRQQLLASLFTCYNDTALLACLKAKLF